MNLIAATPQRHYEKGGMTSGNSGDLVRRVDGSTNPNAIEPKGLKYDSEKPRMDLLDPSALEGLAEVLTFGAKKYAAHNWRGGIEYSRLIAAIYRHLNAINRGEDSDPESGLPHIDHLGCCWMFLSYFMKHRPDLDNRWTDAPAPDMWRTISRTIP